MMNHKTPHMGGTGVLAGAGLKAEDDGECVASWLTSTSQTLNWKSKVDVILYTRKQCHLCDQALQTLGEHGLIPSLLDIDSDEQLRNQFDTCVPVVEINGQIRFRGRVDPMLLRRIMRSEE
jgi:glutaredoxin